MESSPHSDPTQRPSGEAPGGDEVAAWDVAYRQYQRTLSTRYLLPQLEAWSVEVAGRRVLEVGCGDGGCSAAFHAAGARVTALELDPRLVRIARALHAREAMEIETLVGDVEDPSCPGLDRGPFDLIVLRDVVEHLEDLQGALRNLCRALAPEGRLFIVFPPYYSPYGAHQQILPRRRLGPLPANRLPWIQWLPDRWFAQLVAGETPAHREVRRLRGIRLTLHGFARHVTAAGCRIERRRLFLLRPSFRLRYGLPVLPAGPLAHVPFLNELWTTAGYYLVGRALGDASKPSPGMR